MAKIAARVMAGEKVADFKLKQKKLNHVAVKEAVFPFNRFPGVDVLLGPEMRSTGEVMGIDADFGMAFAKSQIGTQSQLPQAGRVFISVKNQDKRGVIFVAKKLVDLGFQIVATKGTAKVLMNNGITVEIVNKVGEGRPNVVDFIKNQKIDLIINTPSGGRTQVESSFIRKEAVIKSINYVTTLSGAEATVYAIERLKKFPIQVRSIQEYHQEILRTLPV